MHYDVSFKLGAVALATALTTVPASADWIQKPLPGLASGAKLAVVAGIAGGVLAGGLVYRHIHKKHMANEPAGPIEIPSRVVFGGADSAAVQFRATGDAPVNLAEMSISGRGFQLAVGSPALPALVKPGEALEFNVSRTTAASRGRLYVTWLDDRGKAHSKMVALLAEK